MVRGLRLLCALFLLGASAARAQAPAQPAAPGRVSVVGTVLDTSTGQPIVGASVQVVGQKARTDSDQDGNFKLAVAPGTYDVRVSADLYKTKVVTGVSVGAGEPARVDVSLSPNVPGNVQLVEVVGVREAAEETQLVKRKEAATMSETIGAETIAKSTDSDAAEVVTRVTGVTIKDDKFIVIRGLNERYSSALLNGSRLPSTDPNRRVVPLDLFPADFIESLTIIKGYTPDLPGDFAGGLVDIRLADPPAELTYEIGISMDFNTETTFQSYDTYKGTWLDWFTLGDDDRDLPGIFGDSPLPGSISTPQQQAYVGSLHDNWNIESATAPPNFSIDGSVGKSFGPFGFSLSPLYGWKFSVHRNEAINNPTETFTYDHSVFETQLGALLTTQYTLSPNHKFSGRALVNRQSINDVLNGDGVFPSLTDQDYSSVATVYTANQLGFGQLEGRHHWSLLDLDWRGAWGPSSQSQPDSKFYSYVSVEGAPPAISLDPPGAQRTFQSLDEFLQDYFVDATVPFETRLPFTDVWSGLPAKLKGGIAYALRDRSSLFRQFVTLSSNNQVMLPDQTLPPDRILIPPNYSVTGPLVFQEAEFEPFDASQEIAAFYGMLDLQVVRDRLRFIGGARLEYSYLKTTGISSNPAMQGQTVETIVNDLDPVPSINLIYTPREDMNVRAGFSQTVSRPDFRELTPTRYPTELGGRTLQGNQFLTTAHITNYDLRWEWFFSPLELASVGFFYKDLKDPIELVSAIETTSYIDLYVNADTATVWGFELEGRKDFAFAVPYVRRVSWLEGVAGRLADLQILLNVSIVESEVEGFTPPPGFVIAPLPGPQQLQGQSPYTINAALEYEDPRWGVFRLLYNTVAPTIAAAGTDSDSNPMTDNLGDVITERRDQLDFVWLCDFEIFGTPVTGKFGIENILNDAYLQNQKFNAESDTVSVVNNYRSGLTFKVGFTYSY